ncbi:MAG: cell wall hydrolase [Devosiaceae bacterium]|nr:cell wall hydrolase [Devosiaceae bacterium MH13]
MRRTASGLAKSSAFALFGALLAVWQTTPTGHLDAAHLLGIDGPGSERWRAFLTASPAGSIHTATVHLDEPRGTALQDTGLGLYGSLDHQMAIAPAASPDPIVTGSVAEARLPAGRDARVTRDARDHLTISPAVHAVRAARAAPVSLFERHPFEQLELASLPTNSFSGTIGTAEPAPSLIIADGRVVEADEGEQVGDRPSPYALAMVDPTAGGSPLEQTDGQQQISAFLNNDRQFRCLAEGIYFEARGEPRRGQVAVAQVIMNRVNHDEFPDTICGVVYQNQHWRNRCQFSFACDGIPERVTEQRAWEESESVARQVLEGRDLIDTITGSTHYHATYVRPRWAPRMIRLDRVGLHIFYKGRYGGWR